MKKIFVFLFLSLFLENGCKYFKKSPQNVDTLTADTGLASGEVVDSTAYYSGVSDESTASQPVQTSTVSAKGNYYMIVGCFTVPENAEKYADKMRSMGYEPLIIPGRDNFQMVAARTYDNYRTSVGEIDKFRNEVSPQAWVYRKR
jgi:SPOR domain